MAILYIFIFLLYFFTQSKYIFGGDSAEFLTASLTFSIPHPPSYPFYTLLAIFFQKIFFFLSPLNALNLLSIFSHILTLVFIKKILSLFNLKKTLILYSLLFYSFIFPIWLYGVVPEVYSLNNLIISALVYFGFKYLKTNKNIYRKIFFICFGLGLAHHHSIVIFFLPFLFLQKKLISVDIFFSFIFIPFYLYPFIASHFNPPIDWENAKTISGLIRLFTRSSYGTFSAYFGSTPNLINQLSTLLSTLMLVIGDFKPLGIFFIIIGLISLKNKKGFLFKYLIFTSFLYLIFLYLTNFNLNQSFSLATFERYLIGFYLILLFFLIFGINSIDNFLLKIKKRIEKFKASNFIFLVYCLILSFYIFFNFFNNLKIIKFLKTANHYEKLAKTLLSVPEKNSILLLKSDITFFPVSYFYYYLKIRPDIALVFPPMFSRTYYRKKVVKEFPKLFIGKSTSTIDFIEKNKNKIIYSEIPYSNDFLPFGILWRHFPKNKTQKEYFSKVIQFNYDFWIKNRNLIYLNYNERKILYYKALWEFYQEKLINFIVFLEKLKKYNELNNFLNNLLQNYDINEYKYLLNLLKNYLKENNSCKELNKINQKFFCY